MQVHNFILDQIDEFLQMPLLFSFLSSGRKEIV